MPASKSAARPPFPPPRPLILADMDLLKHIFSFVPTAVVLRHMLVCKEFLRVLSSMVTHLTVEPECPLDRLLARFQNVTHLTVVSVHCALGLRAAGAVAHACAMPRLCVALPLCPNLTSVDLSRSSPCEAAIAHLCAALPRCASLREVVLDKWHCGTSEAAIGLYAALCRCPRLGSLSLSTARVRSVQHALLPMLPQLGVLDALDLSLNGLGLAGASLLRVALPRCRHLACLNLASNSFGDEGVETLSAALPQCASLTRLNLAGNSVRGVGVLALTQFLPGCPRLGALVLALNEVGPRGVQLLAAAAPLCRKLADLDLSSNRLPPAALRPLLPACLRAPALRRLDLRHTAPAPAPAPSALSPTAPAAASAAAAAPGPSALDFLRAVASTRAQPEKAEDCAQLAWRLGAVRILVDPQLAPGSPALEWLRLGQLSGLDAAEPSAALDGGNFFARAGGAWSGELAAHV